MDMVEIVEALLAGACEDLYVAERAGNERGMLVARAQQEILSRAIALYQEEA